jgi:hypothetical protein
MNTQEQNQVPARKSQASKQKLDPIPDKLRHQLDNVLDAMSEGKTLLQACKLSGINPKDVIKLSTTYSDVDQELTSIRALLADLLADQCLIIADNIESPDRVPQARLQCDQRWKYAAICIQPSTTIRLGMLLLLLKCR